MFTVIPVFMRIFIWRLKNPFQLMWIHFAFVSIITIIETQQNINAAHFATNLEHLKLYINIFTNEAAVVCSLLYYGNEELRLTSFVYLKIMPLILLIQI